MCRARPRREPSAIVYRVVDYHDGREETAMTRHLMAGTVLILAVATAAGAEVKTRVVDYKQGETELQGMIAWDDAVKGTRPGVLVVHEWWGHNEHARNAARKLAAAGYVAFALDMYGKGKPRTPTMR
jgi:hypothetical protein